MQSCPQVSWTPYDLQANPLKCSPEGNHVRLEMTSSVDTRPEDVPKGHEVIQRYVKTLDTSPGVYRMLDAESRVLYVGKARNLRARVSSYARPSGHSARIARMISMTTSMMFLTTKTETEALLLFRVVVLWFSNQCHIGYPGSRVST